MANGGNIRYSVNFDVNKTGLNEIKASLQEIQRLTAQDLMKINNTSLSVAQQDLEKLKVSVKQLDGALDKAFNSDLGTLNVSKFNQELKKLKLNEIYKDFSNAGAAGQAAFRNTTTQILTTNMQLKQTHNLLDNMATTMANTIKWGVASSVMNSFTGSVQQAYGYVKSLDSSLNDIRIVTGYSAEAMDKFAVKANKAAKALGQSTTDYTEASLIYYQQGLSDKEVEARAETTLKAANVTGQSGQEVSEQLTAVWNGYKVTAEEAELYVDKLAAVAASTASDLEELSTGMSKVASAANAMGVDVDQLNAQLATIVSVTRQAPESVGTALKTIYARMSDLKLGGTDEDGLGLGDVSGTMEEMGIEVLDGTGNLRDMGEVIEDVAAKWDTWTKAQQTAMAQVMAGKRQYNNLVALFENWDMYEEALNTSENSMGTLQKQQDIYMESTAAHLQQLKTTSEDLYDSLLDPDGLNPLIDALAILTKGMATFVDSIGGGAGVLLNFGSIGAKVFSKQIAQGIATSVINFRNAKENAAQLQAQMELLSQFKGLNIQDSTTQKLIGWKQEIINLGSLVNAEQHNEANAIIQSTNEIQNQADAWEENKRQAEQYLKTTNIYKGSITGIDEKSQNKQNIDNELKKKIDYYTEAQTKGKEYQSVVNELNAALYKQAEAEEKTAAGSKEMEKAENEVVQAVKKVKESMSEVQQQAELRLNTLRILDQESSEYKELTLAVKEYKAALNSEDDTKIQAAAEKMVAAYQNANAKLKEQAKQTRQVVDQEARGATENFKNALTQAEQTWNSFISKLKLTQQIQQVVTLASSIGQLASAINTILNLGDIINDETLSDGEKALRIISAFSMAIPMLYSGLTGIGSSLIKLASISSATAAGLIETATASGTAAGGVKALGIAIKTLATGPVGIILGIATVLAIVGVAAYKAYNKAADEAKRANEALKLQEETLNKVKEAHEELLSTIDEYKSAREAIEDLTAGTQEWVAAINEANDSVLELLKLYPELSDYVDNINGQLIVDEDGFKKLQELQEESLEQTQRATYGAQAFSLDKQNTSNMVDAGRDIQYISDDGSEAYSVATISEDTIRDVVEAINSSGSGFLKDVESVQNKLNISNEALAQALVDNATELTTLAAEVNANTTAMNLYYQSLADSYLKDNKIYQDSDNQQGIQAAYAQELEKRAEELYEKEYKDKGKLGGGKHDEDIQEEYAKLIGATDFSNEGDNKGKYLINGAWQEIDDATARYALALNEASKGMEDFAVNLIPIVDSISTDTDIQDALLGFSNGNTADLTQLSDEQLTNLDDLEISQEDAIALGYETADEFMKAIEAAVSNERDRRIAESYRTAQEAANEADRLIAQTEGMTEEQGKAWDEAEGAYGLSQQAGINFDDYEGLKPEEILAQIDFSQMPTENLAEWWKKAIEEGAQKAELQKAEDQEMANLDKEIEDLDLDADAVQSYADNLQNVAKESEKVADGLSEDAIAAKKVAIAGTRLNKGLEELQDNFEDQKKALENNEIHTQEYAEAMDGLKDSMGDVLNIDGSALSNDFIVDNLKDIEAAANGDVEAIERLRVAAAQDIIQQVAVNIDDADLLAEMNNITNELSNYAANHDLTIGATLDDTQFIESLNHMITQSGMTAEQVGNYLKALGYDAELSTEESTTPSVMQVPSTTYDIETDPETGMMTKMTPTTTIENVEYEQIVRTPVVKALTYTGSAGGNINYKNTKAGGASTKGKGGGGKGGGGGSKPKKEDKVESKKDRYHDVNVKLSQIDEDLEDVGRKQEKLFGKDLIDALDEELDILEKQRDVLNEKLEIAKEEQSELQKSLKAEGVKFNKDGTIKNYTEVMTAKENALNAMIDKYNHMSAADQEKYQETLDNAKEEYEKFVEMLGNYDDLLLETIPEIENTIQDITDREIEIQIQKLNMEVELRLDLTEAQKEWNEFKREVINGVDSDDIFGNALADADLFSEILQNGTMEALTNNINNTMDQIKSINKTGTSSIFGDDKQAALDNLDEQMSNLMDHMSELTDLQKQISEAYLDMIDEVGEAFDEQIESYEYVGDLINHNMNMIKLVNGEDAYAEMKQLYKEQKENNLSIMQSQKAAVDYYRQMMETETDPEAVEKWTELWKGVVEDLNSTVEDSVEWIIEEYGNAVNEIFDRLDDKMTNGKGLDYLTQEWELKNENADQYLDTINSTYEIQKLERKIQDSINNTDSLSAQKKLNDFMDEELEMLREKEKLTQYDVDRANALYEVKLKEIALEEAQQNKSQMRLRHDASGNYSYQFVADQDSISKAQQELDDARNSLYNMDKDEYRENQQEILDVYTEFQEKMREAANLSAEEKELIEQQYNERINALLEENGYIRTNLMESAFADLAALYGSDIANFQQMSMEEQDILMGQIVPNWDSGIQDMIDTMTNPETGFGPMCKLAMEELDLATQEYNESLAMIKQTSEDSFGATQEGYTTNIELARELAEAQQTNIDRTKEEKDAIGELKLEVDNLVQSYKDAYTAAKDALTAAQKLREYEAEQAAKEAAKNNPGGSGGSGDGDKGSKGDTGGKDGGNGGGKTRLTSEIIDGVAGAIWYWSPSAWGTGNERKQKMESKFGAGAYNTIQSYINDHVTVGGKMKKSFNYGWGERNKYKNYYYSKFDTGGYTGDWPGSDGRMAMLHKKELVLNADDTKNFLSAINLVRDMESMLAAMNDSMLSRTSGMTASLAPSLGFDDAASNTVNQNVNIQASFPGLSSRAEIEEAFKNLVNIASQHAFNTQR